MSQLYDRYCAAALATAARVLGDRSEAEDVVQEVFVRVWDRAADYDTSRGSVAAWIMSSVRNASIDKLRRKDAFHRALDGATAEPRPLPEESEFPEDLKRVTAAVAQLPPDQRQAIELAYFEGLSQSEIASRLKQPLGTVKTRMRLGMQKLRAALAGFEGGAA
ncbi:MAG: sigma-70 family RNA polymerase sigma factor [Planctomycetota bacterium]